MDNNSNTYTSYTRYAQPPNPRPEEPTLGELFGDLSREASLLFRQEIQLAKTELSAKAKRATTDAVLLIGGGLIALTSFFVFVAMFIIALANVVAPWLAALIVGAVLAVIASVLIYKGYSDLKSVEPTPTRTMQSLEEDKEWLKRQISS